MEPYTIWMYLMLRKTNRKTGYGTFLYFILQITRGGRAIWVVVPITQGLVGLALYRWEYFNWLPTTFYFLILGGTLWGLGGFDALQGRCKGSLASGIGHYRGLWFTSRLVVIAFFDLFGRYGIYFRFAHLQRDDTMGATGRFFEEVTTPVDAYYENGLGYLRDSYTRGVHANARVNGFALEMGTYFLAIKGAINGLCLVELVWDFGFYSYLNF